MCRSCRWQRWTDMHLKRYRGKTLKDALRAVRQDLGPDALVLSTQVVQDRGPRGWIGGTVVEIAAAIERPALPEVSALRHTVNEPVDRHIEALAAKLGASGLEPRIARAIEQAMAQPVLLCSPALRPHLWRLFARVLPHLGVLSHNEVPPHVAIVPLATLD